MICAAPCLVLVVMIVFGALSYRRIMRDNAMAEAADRLESLAARVHEFFDRAIVLTRLLASRQKAFGDAPDGDTRKVLAALLYDTPAYDAQGTYIAFENRPYQDADAVQWVWRKAASGKDGSVLRTNDRVTYDYHQKNEQTDWYQGAKAKRDGEFYITKPYFDKNNTNVWMVSVTRPIYLREANGPRFIGVAGVDLKLEDLAAHLQGGMEGASGEKESEQGEYFYMVSRDGLVYALPPDIRAALGNPSTQAFDGNALRDTLPEIASVNATAQSRLTRFTMRDGTSRIVSWKQASEDFADKVVLSLPEAAIYGAASRATTLSIGIGLAALVVMIGVVTTMADHFVSRPIKRLTAAAQAVESGDYSPDGLGKLVIRHDEFGHLARGFRQMVKEVAARERERREAQEDLVRSEQHYRALFENAMDIISVIAPDGKVRFASPSVRSVLGYDPAKLVGREVGPFVNPDDRTLLAAAFQELFAARGGTRTVEFRFRHRDRTWRTLEAKCTTLIDDASGVGIVVNCRDITERKRNEDAIRQLNASLDHRVRLRTAELEQTLEELRGAKEAAERATRQMEHFATGVAHDMRNLLTIIIGYGEDLLRRAIKKNVDAFVPDLKLIANKSNELIELLNDLLCQSKAMSGKEVTLDIEEFDVAGVIQGRMEGIELIAQKNGNTVRLLASHDLGTMVADQVKVSRILMNLLTNACKFTQNGAVTLSVTRERADTGDWLVFQVADTGIGMSPDQVAKLFDRFAQVHEHSGRKQMGFGLGLANSLLYCEAMGGTISVESAVDRGTTFTVRLPAVVQADQRSPSANEAATTRAASAPGPGASTNLILIIDDDASIIELMQRNLGEEGFQTLAAQTGEEGLRLAKEALPSAIILDLVMPGVDGWAVLAALKTDPQTSRIPVVIASILDERERGVRMGADAYVTKPFSLARLSGILHQQLGGPAAPRILLVTEHADVGKQLERPILEQGGEVVTAADNDADLRLIGCRQPDLILIDLPLDRIRESGLIDSIGKKADWDSIPIVLISFADVSPENRRDLQDRVEKLLRKGLGNREELSREIGVLVDEYLDKPKNLAPEESHA